MKETLVNKFNVKESLIAINPSGVNFEKFYNSFDKELRKSLINEKKYLFITIRRLEKRMGIDSLILACSELKKKTNDFMLIIGGKGYQNDYLKEMIYKYKCEDNIKLIGFIPEDLIAKYLSSSDLFILPSIELEGFGLVVLESMACGTPVLTSPYGGAPEVIGKFDRELILSSVDPTVISAKLHKLMISGFLNKTKIKDVQEFVKVNYSWNKFMFSYVSWLSKTF
jgi:glycosyltransferase involved in cell wall biosynthesis